ncbi:MAG: DUF1538 domain-containing protein [Rhodospirillales bacterium]|nr:DUF1538 domain-containing protein [Rhodospirillales bacterium]
MRKILRSVHASIAAPLRDLAPLALVVAFFQVIVLDRPFPDLQRVLIGAVFVVAGLRLFVIGLQSGLFPLGESMAQAFARKGSVIALISFAFALGAATTIAEPALIAVASEGAAAAADAGQIATTLEGRAAYALELRLTVAVSVGCALVLGVLRILKGWPLYRIIIAGYAVVIAITPLAPVEIVGLAYDCGGVTTSTVTVPLVAALGVGLASSLRGRNALTDGFGLIAFASLLPILFVLVFGIVSNRASGG